jgi:hypothetical protein
MRDRSTVINVTFSPSPMDRDGRRESFLVRKIPALSYGEDHSVSGMSVSHGRIAARQVGRVLQQSLANVRAMGETVKLRFRCFAPPEEGS